MINYLEKNIEKIVLAGALAASLSFGAYAGNSTHYLPDEQRSISKEGLQLIKKYEGYKEKAYKCQAGVWTVGYGHTKNVQPNSKINKDQAESYLIEDVKNAEIAVKKYVNVPVTQGQYDSLVSLAYNIGGNNFRKSTTLKEVNNKNYEKAGKGILLWNKAKGKISNGLVKRRNEEYSLFSS
jgi:lysozyme